VSSSSNPLCPHARFMFRDVESRDPSAPFSEPDELTKA
jgi:hypothetical protein